MQTKKMQIFYLLIFFTLFFSIPACDDNGVLPIFQPSYDLKLGGQLKSQISADNVNYPPYNDESATMYLQNIVDELIKVPEIIYSGTFAYKVQIINSKTINAFVTPGGYIYVYTGLIKYLESEAEIAAILAHEIAHADRRHSVQAIQKQYGVSFLVDLFMPDNVGALTKFAADMLTSLAFMKNSRDNEFEADEFSFKYLKSSKKWYPAAGKDFFERMLKQSQGGSNIFEEFFSSHPTDSDRIDRLDKLIKSNNIPTATEESLFRERYLKFKSKFN